MHFLVSTNRAYTHNNNNKNRDCEIARGAYKSHSHALTTQRVSLSVNRIYVYICTRIYTEISLVHNIIQYDASPVCVFVCHLCLGIFNRICILEVFCGAALILVVSLEVGIFF